MDEVFAFEREPFCRELTTEVIEVGTENGRPFVVLADTICFPEGGGQPADRGRVAGVAIEDVRTVQGHIRHYLAGAPPTGTVTVELDWDRRFDHMQQHTGQHLLTAVAQERFGWATTAFHLGADVSDIELDAPSAAPERLQALEDAVAAEIRAVRPVTGRRVSPEAYAGLPVRTRGLPDGHQGDIRLVEIAGLDLNTCGGTHVRSTAELETLKLLGTESMRGGTRLFYAAGGRVRRLLGIHHARTAQLRQLLGASDDELVKSVQSRLDQLKDAQRALRSLQESLAIESARALAAGPAPVAEAHWDNQELPFLQQVAREFARLAPVRVALLTAGAGDQGGFVLCAGDAATLDVAAAGRKVAEILSARGGGSGRMFQGKAGALNRRAEAAALLRAMLA
jgi:Ser-tRNA(Ala) deacylase AlaX